MLTLSSATARAQPPTPPPTPAPTPQAPTGALKGKSLEELMTLDVASVTGASKHEQPVTDAPSSVTIVTAAEIATFGWRTLGDVLAHVRGFYVTYDRNYSYIGVRGFARPTDYNDRVLVLVDGHRTNDAIYDGAYIGTEFPVDLALADRIEIIRGPGSALYGTSAFFAVVNVITKRGVALGGAEASAEIGSFGTYRARASYGWSNDTGRDALLSVTQFGSDGPGMLYYPEFDTPATNGGRVFDLDGDASTNVLAAFGTGRWRVQGLFGTREKHVPTASWSSTFGDPRLMTRDSFGVIDVSYRRQTSAALVAARLFYDSYRYSGTYPQDGGERLNRDASQADAIGAEVTMSRRFWKRHAITAGLEPRLNLRQNQFNYDETEVLVDDRRTSRQIGGYVQDEITLHPRLTATVGARYDWWSLRGGTGRPRVGLVYRPSYNTAIKGLYGEAYRAPNLYELYYDAAAAGSRGNHELRPERLRTSEIVFEHYLNGRVRLAATAYRTRIFDLIDQVLDADGLVHHRNQAEVLSRGYELESEARWTSGLLVRGTYSWQDTDDAFVDDTLSNAPYHLVTLQTIVPVPGLRRQLDVATDTTYVGTRMSVTGRDLPGYWQTNVTTSYRPLGSRLRLRLSMFNLFDKAHSDPVGLEFTQDAIAQDGRTAMVSVTVRF